MRAETEIKSGRILKKVEAPQYLFNRIENGIGEYQSWLIDSGLRIPNTVVTFADGVITFDQELLDNNQSKSISSIVGILQGMSFNRYGMDSNPGNFIGDKPIYFVDFFPFLVRDKQMLSEQFDYPVDTVLRRYFIKANVVTAFINRLFREDFQPAMTAVNKSAEMLISEFDNILPREKDRLLMGIELARAGGRTQDYTYYYYTNKRLETMSADREKKLKDELEKDK